MDSNGSLRPLRLWPCLQHGKMPGFQSLQHSGCCHGPDQSRLGSASVDGELRRTYYVFNINQIHGNENKPIEGCKASIKKMKPTFYSFELLAQNGVRVRTGLVQLASTNTTNFQLTCHIWTNAEATR